MPRALLLTTLVVSTLALLVSGWTAWSLHRSQSPQRIIEARGLVIHDASGQPRVILGAPVPDPLSQGRSQGPRATALSGLILLGPDGSERGGYGTSDRGGEARGRGRAQRYGLSPIRHAIWLAVLGNATVGSRNSYTDLFHAPWAKLRSD